MSRTRSNEFQTNQNMNFLGMGFKHVTCLSNLSNLCINDQNGLSQTKIYGLIIPDKTRKQPVFEARRNVFGDDDSDDENNKKKPIISINSKRQDKITRAKAVVEDPTVFQYDEIYDNIKEKINEDKKKVKSDRNPKYIEKLLKSANKRKLENERRVERQVQKEREKEGDEFADKEIFVTSAYKKKLEEMQKEDEKEKYEEFLENIGDVKKQKDLGGFYRHIYEQKIGSVKMEESEKPEIKRKDEAMMRSEGKVESELNDTAKLKTNRNYRKRNASGDIVSELSEGEVVSDEEINKINLKDLIAAKKVCKDNIDADSDFSDSNESDIEEDAKTARGFTHTQIEKKQEQENIIKVNDKDDKKEIDNKENKKIHEINKDSQNDDTIKPKVDIWKKRTVGIVFEEALKRYYERKSTKSI